MISSLILTDCIYLGERNAIRNIQHIPEEVPNDCIEACETAWRVRESGHQLRHEFRGNNVKAPIADEICSYLEMGANFALQGLRNYQIRESYLNKIMDAADSMKMCLRILDSADVAAAEQLREIPIAFKNFMLEQLNIMRSPLSQAFSVRLHEQGTTFQQLVNRHQQQKFWELRGAPFQSLSDNQKIKVYARIIEASGEGSSLENLISRSLEPAAVDFLLFAAGIMVWGIFSSHGLVDDALRNVRDRGAAVGGGSLVQVLEGAGAAMLIMAGIVNGIDGGVVLWRCARDFVEAFITSGGDPEMFYTHLSYHVAETPDCVALAREIQSGSNINESDSILENYELRGGCFLEH